MFYFNMPTPDNLCFAKITLFFKTERKASAFLSIFLICGITCPKGYPTHRGCRLRADHRLRYLLFCYHPFSMKLRALTLLQHLPLP